MALDLQLATGTATGVGVYARDLADALDGLGITAARLAAPWLDPWRFDRRCLWDQVLLPLALARSGAAVLHATAGTMPALRTRPTVVTVHDMAWLRVQGHTRPYARAYFGWLMARLYRVADAIVVDSQFSHDELRATVPGLGPVDVVLPGVDARFGALVRRPDSAPFALVTGTVEARKNLLRAVALLAQHPTLRVVSIGPPTPYQREVEALARTLGVADRLALLGYVSQAEVDDLYARATCALVPSRYEGFGYALAEALCAGLPVIAARGSSLDEVGAGMVVQCAPDDADAWSEAVGALLADRDAAEAQAARVRTAALARFAWRGAAERLAAIYARLA